MGQTVSAEPGSEGSEGDPTIDEPSGNCTCRWHSEEEEEEDESFRPAFTTNSDATIAAPTVHSEYFGKVDKEQTAMGPSLPAEKVPAASQGGISVIDTLNNLLLQHNDDVQQ